MGVILGTMTQINIQGVIDGFQSINWNINRQPNRLWQLGEWYPWKTQVGATVSISVTTYAGALGTQTLRASTECEISPASRDITIIADSCSPSTSVNINYSDMFITSYSYSKGDPTGFGTETWSFQKWIESGVTGSSFLEMPEPTYILQGISEGNRSGNVANLGAVFFTASEAGGEHVVTGEQGSVNAGFPGIGNADEIEIGIVKQIGDGSLEHGGKTGQSSVTIPHTPLYTE